MATTDSVQARTPEDVILWYDSMREFGCEPIKVTFDSAIEVYSHTGFVVGAVRWLTAMRAAGITPDEATFRWAKRACARASSVPEAEWCFESMIQAGLPPDVGAFTAVINVCAHSGDVGGAEKWFSTMHLAGIWPGAIAYNSVINAHAQASPRCPSPSCTPLRFSPVGCKDILTRVLDTLSGQGCRGGRAMVSSYGGL
jgi:pentatricopeptide repeat protein